MISCIPASSLLSHSAEVCDDTCAVQIPTSAHLHEVGELSPRQHGTCVPMQQEQMLVEMHTMTTERRKMLYWMVAVDCVAGARDGEGILGRSDRGDCWAAVSLEPPDTEDWHNAQMQGNMFESMFGKLAGLPQNSGVLESLSRRYHPRRLSSSSTCVSPCESTCCSMH